MTNRKSLLQEVLGRTELTLSTRMTWIAEEIMFTTRILMLHPHILYQTNTSTESLSTIHRGIHVQRHRMMEGCSGVQHRDGLRSCNIRVHTSFHRVWLICSEIIIGDV